MPACVSAAAASTGATVVLSYHDLDDADDVPDSGATIAAGFSTDSSFYIGNGALNALDIAEAEMCVWYESAGSCVSHCVPITDSDFAYGGPELDWLRSGTHRVIALMSGQLESVTPDEDEHASFYPRKIGSEVGPAWAPPNAWTCSGPNTEDANTGTIRGWGWGWHAWGWGITFAPSGAKAQWEWADGFGNGTDELFTTGAAYDEGCGLAWKGFYIRVSTPPSPPTHLWVGLLPLGSGESLR